MVSFVSGLLVVMSLSCVGPDLETELAAKFPTPLFRRAEERTGKPVVAVTIHRWVVTDAILERLTAYPDLEELRLEEYSGSGVGGRNPPWRVTDAGIAHLKALKHLRLLSIPISRLTDAGLAHVGKMTQLQELQLGYGYEIVADSLQPKFGPESEVANITNAGFRNLKDLRQLHSLTILGTRLTDPGLEVLKEFTQLRHLVLTITKGGITERGLIHLRPLQTLQSLDILDDLFMASQRLHPPSPLDASLAYVRELRNLEVLGICSNRLTEAGLMHIGTMKQLKKLSIGSIPFALLDVSEAGLAHLSGLVALRSLTLDIREITDNGLERLSQLRRLETLAFHPITFRRITDAGLLQLRALTELKSLKLPGERGDDRPRITQGGIDELKRSLPDLDVRQGWK